MDWMVVLQTFLLILAVLSAVVGFFSAMYAVLNEDIRAFAITACAVVVLLIAGPLLAGLG